MLIELRSANNASTETYTAPDPNNVPYRMNVNFKETMILKPNSRISLVSCSFSSKNTSAFTISNDNNTFQIELGFATTSTININLGTYSGAELATVIQNNINSYIVSKGLGVLYPTEKQEFSYTNDVFTLQLLYSPPNLQEQKQSVGNGFQTTANALNWYSWEAETPAITGSGIAIGSGVNPTNLLVPLTEEAGTRVARVSGFPSGVATDNNGNYNVNGICAGLEQGGGFLPRWRMIIRGTDNRIQIDEWGVNGAWNQIVDSADNIYLNGDEFMLQFPDFENPIPISNTNVPQYFVRQIGEAWKEIPIPTTATRYSYNRESKISMGTGGEGNVPSNAVSVPYSFKGPQKPGGGWGALQVLSTVATEIAVAIGNDATFSALSKSAIDNETFVDTGESGFRCRLNRTALVVNSLKLLDLGDISALTGSLNMIGVLSGATFEIVIASTPPVCSVLSLGDGTLLGNTIITLRGDQSGADVGLLIQTADGAGLPTKATLFKKDAVQPDFIEGETLTDVGTSGFQLQLDFTSNMKPYVEGLSASMIPTPSWDTFRPQTNIEFNAGTLNSVIAFPTKVNIHDTTLNIVGNAPIFSNPLDKSIFVQLNTFAQDARGGDGRTTNTICRVPLTTTGTELTKEQHTSFYEVYNLLYHNFNNEDDFNLNQIEISLVNWDGSERTDLQHPTEISLTIDKSPR